MFCDSSYKRRRWLQYIVGKPVDDLFDEDLRQGRRFHRTDLANSTLSEQRLLIGATGKLAIPKAVVSSITSCRSSIAFSGNGGYGVYVL